MNFYVKKLYPNELGIRKGIPNKAGKFLLISKKRAVFLFVFIVVEIYSSVESMGFTTLATD